VAQTAEVLAPTGGGRNRDYLRRSAAIAAQLRAYVALTKPRIIELLLVTTLPTMLLAAEGLPSLTIAVATLAGGALTAASANTINCYIDRDIDRLMRRTARRPLVQGQIRPVHALVFGVALGVAGTALLAVAVNWPSAVLADTAIGVYVFIYTMGLKRRSPSNIVIGGAAGCFPVLVGWSAVTGTVGWPAIALFAVVFFWTPPHFWALALRFEGDYAAAGVPMLPVVAEAATVSRRILGYSVAMVAASLALVPAAGWVYGVGAAALGAAFLLAAARLHGRVRVGAKPDSLRLFHHSISYLTLLFALVAVAPFLP
jgi:protoheme IX farnesyltransferase